MIWIDEEGRICRPSDSQYGTDTFTAFHKRRSGPYLDMLRAWAKNGDGALPLAEARKQQLPPSEESQLARTERALAWHLLKLGKTEAAERHFERATQLAPKDWTIRRGSMPLRGANPFGPDFFEMAKEGKPDYPMEALTPTQDPDAAS